MREAGYGPDKHLKIKVSTRNVASYRDLAGILIDHLRHIYIDGELEMIDSAVYFNRLYQKSYVLVLNATGSRSTIPTSISPRTTAAARAQLQRLLQSRSHGAHCRAVARARYEKRRAIVRDVERALVEDTVRPIIAHPSPPLPATAGQGPDHYGQQHLQWLAFRGRLARSLTWVPWWLLRRSMVAGAVECDDDRLPHLTCPRQKPLP